VEGAGNRLMLSSNPLETIRSACPSHGRGRRFNPCSAHQPSLLPSYGWQTGRCARDSEEPRRHMAHGHATFGFARFRPSLVIVVCNAWQIPIQAICKSSAVRVNLGLSC
jgi:hypothetical protein